ncbi:MAG: sulfite exporter TauE/SafE family protein [Oscillospiraceae bacterium]|jgi:sulfite exporter TauE/SafE/copper chaperone CopZ|nr:sulfite exporter TauE/SafE family protein [Oscillospiraceae bacterium]
MENRLKTIKLHIGGMTCVNCQNKIQKKLRGTRGIQKAEVDYARGSATLTYDPAALSLEDISGIIEKLGYEASAGRTPASGAMRTAGFLVIIVALYMVIEHFGLLNLLVPNQLAESGMGYGMLFVIGLLTSVHCVAMCGGINLSQSIAKTEKKEPDAKKNAALRPAFFYNLGRVISYTAVGFIVGALGSAVTFSNTAQGVLKLVAGIFMVIMGVNMLGIFPWLRKLNLRMPKAFASKINTGKAASRSPLIVGLLNGLMPCGPLQAMQIYALSTGSAFAGALSMLLFSLGTVPLMFGLGALSSFMSKKFTKKVMAAGAVLVVVLGLTMLTQGWSLSGMKVFSPPDVSETTQAETKAPAANGVQVIESTLSSNRYPAITVQAGVPVKWIINAPSGSINGCNNNMIINEYNITHTFTPGENVIEFTPSRTGTFRYSCWMGMIRSTITVK